MYVKCDTFAIRKLDCTARETYKRTHAESGVGRVLGLARRRTGKNGDGYGGGIEKSRKQVAGVEFGEEDRHFTRGPRHSSTHNDLGTRTFMVDFHGRSVKGTRHSH